MTHDNNHFVYHQYAQGYAMVHRSTCHHCNDGYGKAGAKVGPCDEFRGPYNSRDEALSTLKNGNLTIALCKDCSP